MAVMRGGLMSPVPFARRPRPSARATATCRPSPSCAARPTPVTIAPVTRRSSEAMDAYLAGKKLVALDGRLFCTRCGAAWARNSLAEDVAASGPGAFPAIRPRYWTCDAPARSRPPPAASIPRRSPTCGHHDCLLEGPAADLTPAQIAPRRAGFKPPGREAAEPAPQRNRPVIANVPRWVVSQADITS